MLSIITCEDEYSVETTFVFLVACNGTSARTQSDDSSTKLIEVKVNIPGLTLSGIPAEPSPSRIDLGIKCFASIRYTSRAASQD